MRKILGSLLLTFASMTVLADPGIPSVSAPDGGATILLFAAGSAALVAYRRFGVRK